MSATTIIDTAPLGALIRYPSLNHARVTLAAWRKDYNTERPHSRLAGRRLPSSPKPSPRNGA